MEKNGVFSYTCSYPCDTDISIQGSIKKEHLLNMIDAQRTINWTESI